MRAAYGEMIFAIVLGIGLLFFALKFGTIGGSGAGAERDRNPILFWMGVTITALGTLLIIIVLIWTLLGVPPPLAS
jgi:hypothetical protein